MSKWVFGDSSLYLLYYYLWKRTHVDVHTATTNQFWPDGWPWKFLLQLLSPAVPHWKSTSYIHYVRSKIEHSSHDALCCSIPVSNQKKICFISILKFQYQATRDFFLCCGNVNPNTCMVVSFCVYGNIIIDAVDFWISATYALNIKQI